VTDARRDIIFHEKRGHRFGNPNLYSGWMRRKKYANIDLITE
jgi:hypothetical protein